MAVVDNYRFHPSVRQNCSDEALRLLLTHGDVMQQHGDAVRLVYGYLTCVVVDDTIYALYERDRINDVSVLSYDELEKHPHFYGRMKDRDLYEEETRDVVDSGVFFYNQYTWYYFGEVESTLIKIVRSGDTLKTVHWLGENPRDWSDRGSTTNTYMERRRARLSQ